MKKSRFHVIFTLAGGLLVLFVILPIASTILSTSPGALAMTIADNEVSRSIGLTFLAAAIATGLAVITGVPLAYLLARGAHLGARGIWAALTLGWIFQAALMWLRFRQGRWKLRRI